MKVHENVHLVEQCIALLNEEWPRESTSRRKTISRSSDRFTPLCLALVEVGQQEENEKVIGFVKLTSEMSLFDRHSKRTIFLESLVVSVSHRGLGLGRLILQEVERLLQIASFDRINLTTTDKESFYEKMGYCRLFAEAQQKTCTQTEKQRSAGGDDDQKKSERPEKQDTVCSGHLPPPPPIPPMFTSSKIKSTKNSTTADPHAKIFMYKMLTRK